MTESQAKVYGLVGKSSNSWKSPNPNSGCYEADTARTLDTNGGDATCNQGGNIVVYPEKARTLTARADSSPTIDRGQNIVVYENHQQDDRITDVGDIAPTVAAKYGTGGNNTPLVTYALDRAAYNQGVNAQFDISVQAEQAQTVVAKGPGAVAQPYTVGNGQPDNLYLDEKARTLNCMHDPQIAIQPQNTRYIVRRLTPLECCRLQGYPDHWAQDLETPEPTEQEIDEWEAIFRTHRDLTGKPGQRPNMTYKSRYQIAKWLKNPHSDSAEYKIWGNSLAIPNAYNVLQGIADELREEANRTLTIKEQKAIARINEAYLIAERMGKTLIVAYSGGKDSDVLLDLAIKSEVPFEVQHNHTTADAPETIYHIRAVFKRLTEQGIPTKINYPDISMWRLIEKKGMPPTSREYPY